MSIETTWACEVVDFGSSFTGFVGCWRVFRGSGFVKGFVSRIDAHGEETELEWKCWK